MRNVGGLTRGRRALWGPGWGDDWSHHAVWLHVGAVGWGPRPGLLLVGMALLLWLLLSQLVEALDEVWSQQVSHLRGHESIRKLLADVSGACTSFFTNDLTRCLML